MYSSMLFAFETETNTPKVLKNIKNPISNPSLSGGRVRDGVFSRRAAIFLCKKNCPLTSLQSPTSPTIAYSAPIIRQALPITSTRSPATSAAWLRPAAARSPARPCRYTPSLAACSGA